MPRTPQRLRSLTGLAIAIAALLVGSAGVARAEPSQADVFRSIQDNVGHNDSISTKGLVATGAVVGGIAIVAVVYTQQQKRREMAEGGWGSATSGSSARSGRQAAAVATNNSGKLVRELMKEAGLTKAQVRQLEAVNARLANEDRDVRHLATLLLCPSLIAAARPESIVEAA